MPGQLCGDAIGELSGAKGHHSWFRETRQQKQFAVSMQVSSKPSCQYLDIFPNIMDERCCGGRHKFVFQ